MILNSLSGYLDASAARHEDRIAVVEPSGASVTYAELLGQADALAGFLVSAGVKRGDRVGLVLPKSIPAVVGIFAIMKAGAAYVPVDCTVPAERGRAILTDCQISAIIVDSAHLEMIPHQFQDVGQVKAVIVVGSGAAMPTEEHYTTYTTAIQTGGTLPADPISPDDLAYILYTSGSTGMPKGVMISHANALTFAEWFSQIFDFRPSDRFSAYAPFHFDFSIVDIFLAVKSGATICLITEDLSKNFKELARFIAEQKLTVWSSTPTALTLLLQFGNLPAHDYSSLRHVVCGGEVFPVKHLRELKRHWARPVFYNIYGPTEITVACTLAEIPAEIPPDRESPYPIGFIAPHCQALLLNAAGDEVAPGEEGLLHITGPSVTCGYWNRPAENARAFVNRDGVRWYNTGDVVTWNEIEGFTYVGRNDRMIKRRGYRIELGEIERALYLHPAVTDAAVICIHDDAGPKIVAFFTASDGSAPSIIGLKTFCASKLPSYMIPDCFVQQPALPQTTSGKVDYQALKHAQKEPMAMSVK
jgi:amino acid adenylation domain-containing protein